MSETREEISFTVVDVVSCLVSPDTPDFLVLREMTFSSF